MPIAKGENKTINELAWNDKKTMVVKVEEGYEISI
jgi:hypothetical protein